MDKRVLNDIYRFWFGDAADREAVDPARIRYWMMRSDDTDAEIRTAFGHLFPACGEWRYEFCDLTHEEAMALVVLYDQFPRNLYRTTGDAFAYDHRARELSRQLLESGTERFSAMERFILRLPFVHHEDVATQDFAVQLVEDEIAQRPQAVENGTKGELDQTIRHRDVIARFGRFPHRNVMLGRESTPEELAFLATALRGRGF